MNNRTIIKRANDWLKTLHNDFANYMIIEDDSDDAIGSCGSVFKMFKRIGTDGGIDTYDPSENVKYCLKVSPLGTDENDPRYKISKREFQIIDDIQSNDADDVCVRYYYKDVYMALDQDYAFIIMQYATNTLERHVSERLLNKLDFSSREALQIMKQICFALKKLQSWKRYNRNDENSEPLVLIHNDLRPVNILVDYKAGGIPKVRLTDFGVATYANESANRLSDRNAQPNKANKALALGDYSIEFGSSPFYAPERGELATEEKVISTKTDIYSVGALAAWMLAKDPDAMLDALSRYRRGIVELSEIKGLIKDDVVKVINDFSLNKLEECLYPYADRNASLDDIVEEIEIILDNLETTASIISSILPIESYTKRANLLLKNKKWDLAVENAERILDIDPANGTAYLIKLLSDYQCSTITDLASIKYTMDLNKNYQRVLELCDESISQSVESTNNFVRLRLAKELQENEEIQKKEETYLRAKELCDSDEETLVFLAIDLFDSIKGYKDSEQLIDVCYANIKILQQDAQYVDKAKIMLGISPDPEIDKKIEIAKDQHSREIEKLMDQLKEIEIQTLYGITEIDNKYKHRIDELENTIAELQQKIVALEEDSKKLGFIFLNSRRKSAEADIIALSLQKESAESELNYLKAKYESEITEQQSSVKKVNALILQKMKNHNLLIQSMKNGKSHFGIYYKDDETMMPLEWELLTIKKGKALIIAKKCIDCKPYNEANKNVTWQDSTIREWLNNEFVKVAFTSEEQALIIPVTIFNDENEKYGTDGGTDTVDRVFLLSIDEVDQYFSSNDERKATSATYAKGKNVLVDEENGNSPWWLRSPGYKGKYAANVNPDGSVYFSGSVVGNSTYGIRPAMWIKIVD